MPFASSIPALSWEEALLRIVVAAAFGGAIGLERELREREAGFRTLWLVAAVGLATGAGYYSAAAITTVVTLVSLWPLRILAHAVVSRFRPETGRLVAQLPAGQSTGPLIGELERLGGQLVSLE